MIEELRRRNFAESTIRAYVHSVEHFSRYFHRRPDQLGPAPRFTPFLIHPSREDRAGVLTRLGLSQSPPPPAAPIVMAVEIMWRTKGEYPVSSPNGRGAIIDCPADPSRENLRDVQEIPPSSHIGCARRPLVRLLPLRTWPAPNLRVLHASRRMVLPVPRRGSENVAPENAAFQVAR